MKKINFKVLVKCLVLAFIAIIVSSSFVIADVGNFNSYDSGSDWSSSSWDYDYDDYDYDSGSSGGGGIGLIIFIVIVIIVIASNKSNKLNVTRNFDSNQIVTNNSEKIVDNIRKNDPNFSEEKFLSWTKDLFVKLQSAWTARDFESIRTFETKDLFEQHSRQLNEYVINNKINVVERVSVSYAKILDYENDGSKEVITVILNAKMKDYIIDANTSKLLEGDKDRYWNMSYRLKFVRTAGKKTKLDMNASTTSCPSCGAPTNVTSSGKCEYCGNVIVTDDHDWVLSALEAIK